MAFEDLQNELEELRRSRDDVARKVFRDREGLKRLEVERREVGRRHGPDSDAAQALERRAEERSAALEGGQAELRGLLDREDRRLKAFEPFTDPREHLSKLPDDDPVLLFPLRLETRFKRVAGGDGETATNSGCASSPTSARWTRSTTRSPRARSSGRARTGPSGGPRANRPTTSVEELVEDRHRGAWRKLMGALQRRARVLDHGELPAGERGGAARARRRRGRPARDPDGVAAGRADPRRARGVLGGALRSGRRQGAHRRRRGGAGRHGRDR